MNSVFSIIIHNMEKKSLNFYVWLTSSPLMPNSFFAAEIGFFPRGILTAMSLFTTVLIPLLKSMPKSPNPIW